MIIKGKYNNAEVFTDEIEEEAISQIKEMCDMKYLEGCDIRIMPDVHAGKGCTIGTTIKIKDKICPNYVGVDIGCGVAVYKFRCPNLDLKRIDEYINNYIPSGTNVYERRPFHTVEEHIWQTRLDDIKAPINKDRALKSLGTLGGGNHFIEIAKEDNDDDFYYLIIHTGSRHLGVEVAKYYQEQAYRQSNSNKDEIDNIIKTLKNEGREKEIEQTIKEFKNNNESFTKDNAYVEGDLFENYLSDIDIVQTYAWDNRNLIAKQILANIGADLNITSVCVTIHNYIDKDSKILRKGSVRAKKGEIFILPLNMRDGSLLCEGKGNPDWNESAPHGANGRDLFHFCLRKHHRRKSNGI